MRALNRTRGSLLAERCAEARSFLARGRGLMGQSGLPAGGGLLIDPCGSIHMLFMQFAIDAVFVGRDGRVVALYADLPPWRLYAGSLRARYVLELPAGTIAASRTGLGDEIGLERP